jgi:hypothetical protein
LIDGEEERQTLHCWEQEMLGKRSPQGDLFTADTQCPCQRPVKPA